MVGFSLLFPARVQAATPASLADSPPIYPAPVVAIHVSELTKALETQPVASTPTPQPPGTPGASGTQWFDPSWHYFVIYGALIEALRSDGTPFVIVSDADIRSGSLLLPDGLPKYPILISLAAEAASDDEIAPLLNYVSSGGFLLVGSSAFTRNPDGSTRGDFAIAEAMGVHMATASLENWVNNQTFTKMIEHRLVAHIPKGNLVWKMPLSAEQINWGTSANGHFSLGLHADFRVRVSDATVIARGSGNPLIATKSYGKGTFIYHADREPLLGFGGADAGMYAYGIYRNAIQWAFEAANLPMIRLSPWRYQYNSAFILRHDFENTSGAAIEGSAKAEAAVGAKGDYYFCTGVLRDQLNNDPTIVASLRRAVSLYGATIGPHNGGLKNPNNSRLTYADFEYWHWGPDEAFYGTAGGYSYALESATLAYQDIDRWLAGLDNGRAGCGASGNCPRIWTAPYFNSNREDSLAILNKLNVVSEGEQKISPFPHYTLSTQTDGMVYPQVSLPVSDWYVGNTIAQSIESGHTVMTVRHLVDFYYDMGALVNLYGHTSSANGLMNYYMRYILSRPRMWSTNSVGIADWWALRSKVSLTPEYRQDGGTVIASALIRGASDPDTAVDVVIPHWNPEEITSLRVFLNGSPAGPDDFRVTQDGIKIKVGALTTQVEVRLASHPALAPQAGWQHGTFQSEDQ